MKRVKFFLPTLLLSLAFAAQGFAYSFVSLYTNPFVDPSYDFGTSTTGYVEYTAVMTGAVPPGDTFTGLELFFGGVFSPPFSPIFKSAVFDISGFVSNPGGWSLTSFSDGVLKIGGSGLSVGQAVVFRVTYELFNPAGAGPLGWSSADPWSQNFAANSALGNSSPGSAQLVPEPGTVLLLGSGLFGLGLVKRFRQRRKMQA
jgi:hypothetical protein